MIAVGREPLLLVALVTRLEIVPLLAAGHLDPRRAEARVDGKVDEARQVAELPGGCAWPHGGEFGCGWGSFPEPLAEQHPPAGVDQPPQRPQRGYGVLGGLDLAERMAGSDAQDEIGGPAGRPDGGLPEERDALCKSAGPGVVASRARSPSSVSSPRPVAAGTASSIRSISSPQPEPMSRIVPGPGRASLSISRPALASDSGPWKASRVRLGGRSASAVFAARSASVI